jgi:hypothetical protein
VLLVLPVDIHTGIFDLPGHPLTDTDHPRLRYFVHSDPPGVQYLTCVGWAMRAEPLAAGETVPPHGASAPSAVPTAMMDVPLDSTDSISGTLGDRAPSFPEPGHQHSGSRHLHSYAMRL